MKKSDERMASQERIAAISAILVRFHRNACYPDAMPYELYQAATEIDSVHQQLRNET